MNNENPTTQFDFVVEKNHIIEDIFKGSILVNSGVILNVQGIAKGKITISKGAALEVNGIFKGEIYNEGNCSVAGILEGRIINNDGIIKIDPKAIVREQQ